MGLWNERNEWWKKEGYVIVVNREANGMYWITLGEFPDATPRWGAKHRKSKECYVKVILSIPEPKELAKDVFFRDVYSVNDFTDHELGIIKTCFTMTKDIIAKLIHGCDW